MLFLLALLIGLAVPVFAVPRLALSVHLLGLMQGLFLLATGMLWPRLHFTRAQSIATFWLLAYGCVAAWTVESARRDLGRRQFDRSNRGRCRARHRFQETVIVVMLRSGGAALIFGTALLLWGLRGGGRQSSTHPV